MKRKRISAAILCALTALLAAGCNPMDDSVQSGTQSDEGWQKELDALGELKPGGLPDRLKLKVSDQLSFDAQIGISQNLEEYQVPTLSVTRHLFDPKADMDKLLDFFQVTDIRERTYTNKEDFLENGKEIYVDNVELDDEGSLQVRDLYLIVRFPTDVYYFADFRHRYKDPLFTLLRENEELDFDTIEGAKAAAQDFFDRMGIDVMEPRVYAASQQTLEDIALQNRERMAPVMSEEELDEMFPLGFTKEQEAYYMIYRQGYQGVPYMAVESDYSLTNADMQTMCYCNFIYSASGICEIDTHCMYDIEQVQEEEEILSLREILQQYIDLYKDNPQSRLVSGVDLEYLLVMTDRQSLTFEAKPVWHINAQRSLTEEEQMPERVIFDAVTGELLEVLDDAR